MIDGHEAAFDTFFDRYADRLYRFALSYLPEETEVAKDMVQATLTAAIQQLRAYRAEASLYTWLCAICRNQIAARWRREGSGDRLVTFDEVTATAVLDTLSAAEHEEPERRYERLQLAALIQQVLDALPGHQGDALALKYLRGLSVREIADELRVSATSVQSLLARGRDSFRTTLSELLGVVDGEGLTLAQRLLGGDGTTPTPRSERRP